MAESETLNSSKACLHKGKLYAPCGISGDAFSFPVTNFAKAGHPKHWKPARQPAGWQA